MLKRASDANVLDVLKELQFKDGETTPLAEWTIAARLMQLAPK